RLPGSSLFPYTTLFRSSQANAFGSAFVRWAGREHYADEPSSPFARSAGTKRRQCGHLKPSCREPSASSWPSNVFLQCGQTIAWRSEEHTSELQSRSDLV